MNKSSMYELERIQTEMKAAFVRGSLTAATFIIVGVALAFVYFKYVKAPRLMVSNFNHASQKTCQVEMQWGQAESHVYTGKLSTPHLKQQDK